MKEKWISRRSTNGCDCPICVQSLKKEELFNSKIKDKEKYYEQRMKDYVVDDLIFDISKDITYGDMIYWSENEHRLFNEYKNMFGLFNGYTPISNYRDMGRDIDHEPKIPKEDRAINFIIDTKLILQNAMSDNPKLNLMTDGEKKIYKKIRQSHYLNPKDRKLQKELFDESMKNIFKNIDLID